MTMRRLGLLVVVVAVFLAAAPSAWAQRGGRGGFGGGFGANRLGLLAQSSVQDELKLSEDQKKQVGAEVEKSRAAMSELRGADREQQRAKFQERTKANDAAVASILNADQAERFKQISLQQQGPSAYADPEVAKELGLTSEQQDKIKGLTDGLRSEMRAQFQGGGGGEARAKLEELRKVTDEKLKAVLTPEQQTKWTAITGEPFKGEIRRPLGRGGNRPGANLRPNRRPNRQSADRKA